MAWGLVVVLAAVTLLVGVLEAIALRSAFSVVSVSPVTVNSTATYTISGGSSSRNETISSFTVNFPSGTDLTNVVVGSVTPSWQTPTGFSKTATSVTVTFSSPVSLGNNTALTLAIADVVNLSTPGSYAVSGSHTGSAGGSFGPLAFTLVGPELTVTQGSDAGRPTVLTYAARSTDRVVDELSLSATNGAVTVSQIVVRGLDTVGALQTDVSEVKLYVDDGTTPGDWDVSDTPIGTPQTFSGQASGSTATFLGLSLSIPDSTTQKVWIVYTIGASAVDGHIVGSQVQDGDVTVSAGTVNTFATITSAASGQTIQVDAAAPSANTSDPLDNAVLTGTSKTISGTASDGTGSGLAAVDVRIARSDGQYWTGSGWSVSETWVAATGTTNWTYSWSLDAGQNNGPLTYTITARATDNVGLVGTDATPVTGVKVDNVAPTISSAVAVDATTVDVLWSEALQSGSISSTDFTIAGLTVSNAVLQPDNVTVRLTTSSQTANQSYTVQCNAGNVLDAAGNGNTSTSANFTGYVPAASLAVSQGNDVGRPTALSYAARSTNRVVDELVLTSSGGTMTLSQVVVRGLDTVGTLQTDVAGVRLYRDNGPTVGQWDGGDTQLGSTQTFSGQASGSTATFSGLSLAIPAATTEKVWVVYTIGASAVDGHIVGSQLQDGDVTATGGTVNAFTTITSANSGQTIQIDATAPTADTTDPINDAVLTGTSKTISGTASDGTGSGVASVDVRIGRSDGQYWTGSSWSGTETWVAAAGTTNWTYNWSLDAGQNNGPLTYTITARATDNVGLVGTDATPVTGVKVDNVAPTISSAVAVDATTVDVLWSEALQSGSISSTDFTIAGLTVSNAVLQPDNVTVRLTTSSQTANQSYTVQCDAGNVLDAAGNGNTSTSANFTGYAPVTLAVTQGNGTSRPTTLTYAARSSDRVVDQLRLTTNNGPMTLSQIVVRGLDTVGTLQTDVSGVKLYVDDGDATWDAGDTQLGTTQTFSGQASGSTATFAGLNRVIEADSAIDVWVVYTIGASAVDGHVVGSQVQDGDVTATGGTVNTFATITSAASGQTIQIDATAPTANTTDPLDNAVLTGTSKTISGTASDGTGSGLAGVQVRIARSDGQYWTGLGWSGTETWVAATGTTNWTYAWSLDAGQNNGPLTYTITARATDNVGLVGTDATPVTGVKVDNVAPTIVSAVAVDATTVDVLWSEALQSGSISSTDFTIAGLTVSNAVLQPDNVTVRLTTSSQTANQSYTVQCDAGNVLDIAGNGNTSTNANFTGYAPAGTLTVTQGADSGRPSTKVYAAQGENRVVDELALTSSGGPVTLSQIVVRGLNTVGTLQTDVTSVRLFRDNGTTAGQWDGGDTQLGSTQTFSGQASGSTAIFSGLSLAILDSTTEKVWIVYTIGASAVDGHVVGSQVQDGDVTVSFGSVNTFATITSAASGQTIQIDATAPTADTTDPINNAVLTGTSKTISGTASDGTGSGLAAVDVRIARSDGQYWTGSGWSGTETWVAATGTASWTYAWSLDAGQNNGPLTYTITARATDNVGLIGTDATPVTGVKVDNVAPTISSASAPDETHVNVVFSEALQPGSIASTDFTIAGLTISEALLQVDGRTVRLTTSAQAPSQSYTVQCNAGNVLDTAGNANTSTSASFSGWTAGADVEPPSVPSNVVATAGAMEPTIASVTWDASSDNVAVVGYYVWRAMTPAGPYERLDYVDTLSYSDTTGVPGQDYFYAVSAYDAVGNESIRSLASGPVRATWNRNPHADPSPANQSCSMCHEPHEAVAEPLLRPTGGDEGQLAICYSCHDGSGSEYNVKDGAANSFARESGHAVEDLATPDDLTNVCSDCHAPHQDYLTKRKLPRTSVNGAPVTGNNNTWCQACHNDANDWYGAGYPAMATPTRDATGYPVLGTYPGASVYNDPAKNAHASIPSASGETTRAAGACLYCHAAHRGTSAYDSLTKEFRPTSAGTLLQDQSQGTYAESCFECHGDGALPFNTATPPTNIEQFVTAGGANSGHRIKTAGGKLPVGAPLPCYDCHNPHGSERNNASLISDELGTGLGTSSASDTRKFCFSCHASWDGQIWNSNTLSYQAVGLQMVEGLRRDGSDGSVLRLPNVVGHGWGDTGSCTDCHGKSYGAGGNNVHDPGPGASTGGMDCFVCHDYQSMQSANSYHHYMVSDAATPTPVIADPSTITTSDSRRTCLTCHVDHNFFDPAINTDPAHTGGRAQNLRSSISVEPTTTDGTTYLNTDHNGTVDPEFDASAGGVCTSCHQVQMDKNTTGRKSSADRFDKTIPIGLQSYFQSAHNYAANTESWDLAGTSTTFTADASTFSANCGKCHNDDMAKSFQTGPFEFGMHDSTHTALQTDAGQPAVSEDPQEQLCWLCHSRAFETNGPYNPNGGSAYTGDLKDIYGGGPVLGAMMDFSGNTKGLFTNPSIVSRHPVAGDGVTTARVECVNCHNVHKTQPDLGFFGDGTAQDPDNTLRGGGLVAGDSVAYYSSASLDTDYATNRDYCLKCHDGAPPTKVNDGTAYVPYDVYMPSDKADKSAYLGRSHFNAVAADTSATAQTIVQQCSTCHDNHGSTLPSLLGQNNAVVGTPTIMGSPVTGNNNTVCYACHTSGSGGAFTYDVTGYPKTGPWPGQSTYDTAYNSGTHTGNGHLNAVWPGRSDAAGDCKNCHDVHGTANDYDQLRTEDAAGTEGVYGFSSDDMSLCFNCHDGDPAAADIKSMYPAAAGGTSTGTRAGHRVLSDTSGLPGATLSQGDAVPCYDCHNPHGSKSSYMLQVRNIGDEVTDAFDLSDGPGVREFCFACHLTSDSHKGWNGTAYAAVVPGTDDTVEGITRDSSSYKLLLPALTDHTEANDGDCFGCHADPHEPSGGVSAGGVECYTCHKSLQQTMDADGTNRTSYYHHVLGTGGGTYSGDTTFASGSYPGAGTDVYCMSCHVDHDTFNSSKASNLRADMTAGSAASNTDFPVSGPGTGVCVGCHSVSLVKDVANQKSSASGTSNDESTNTPKIDGTAFPGSSHNYATSSTFGDSTSFAANCSKCHNDEDIGGYKRFQTSENKFGPHFSSMRRLLTAFGMAATDPIGDYECYGCHAPANSYTDAKTTAGGDWYATPGVTMSPLTEKVYTEFFMLGSQHPVESTGGTGLACVNCHNAHVVSSAGRVSDPDNTYNLAPFTTTAEQAAFCLKCHDGAQPTYQVSGSAYVPQTVEVAPANALLANKSTYQSRGHWTANGSISSAETVACERCHDNHGSNAPKLLGEYQASDDSSRINNHIITANDNSVCFACHSAASTSFPAGEAQREAGTGYLMDGTWPGELPYTASYNPTAHTGNGHLTATWPGSSYAAGDCKNCHDVHGTENAYDALRPAYTDANFTMCFECHGADAGSPGYASSNIEQYYPVAAGGTGTGDNAGHQIKTAGGNLAVGDAMPCYNCHNPHGTRGQFMLQVRDIGDVAGEIDVSDDSGVREFCFTCHATSDTSVGWTGSAYVAVGTTTVEGLRRDGSDGSGLKLPSVTGHRSTDAQSCYQCHLNGPGNNPHNPSAGVSSGGLSCYTCHSEYQRYMEDDSGALTGVDNATVYHHVLGGAAGDGDIAPNTGAYPTSGTDVYCVSCHTDHNYFNASKSSNLRSDIANSSGAAVSDSDYSTSTNTGICTSCHAVSRAKQGMGTEQKDDGSTATPKILAGAGANQFGASAHNYTTTSTFGDSTTFKANCSKCHNDENNPAYKTFQTSANKFGTHWSAERRILSALGGTLVDPLSEAHCYRCHSGGTAGNDYYGSQPMSQAARRTQQQFELAYKHPVVASGGNSVECANCHNPHVVTAGTGKVTDPANTYNTIAYGTEAEKATFCLKCHSSAATLPSYTVNDTTYVPSTVTIATADQPLMDKSAYGARGHWSVNGSISSGEVNSCGVCHAKHGSSYAKMLGAYDPATGTNKVNGAAITGNNNTVCAACHTSASSSFPMGVRGVDGYPTDGTWPGTTVYNLSYDPVNSVGSMHNTANTVLPGKTYAGGDCKNCHDVHGTANTRDELRTEDAAGTHGVNDYSPSNFTFCFNCHDTDGPASRNIKTYYPATVGGSAGGSGHEIKTAGGTLPVGGVLPCYNCHNPHGSASASYGLTIVSAIDGTTNVLVGDSAGEILMSPANQAADPNNVRKFCFTCHTTADTTKGWNGSAYVTISLGAKVEGIDRTTSTVLNLPARAGHNEADTTQSCYGCHGNDYASLSGNNVHNPSGGISAGGSDCYTCHATFQTYMEDGIGTKVGASRATVYHHVLGGTISATYYDGDKAFANGSYPTVASEVFCLSCHVDHNWFNGSKSGNLRNNSTNSNPNGANYDYSTSLDTGVCVGCHAASRTKQVGTDQKSDGSTATPKIVAGSGANQFGASAHNYYATSTFDDATTFNANCSKCHNDENSPTYKDFQTSTNRFGTHWSAERRILSALGGTLADPLSETHCYGCHSGATAGNDYYGVQPMTQAARTTQAQFGLTSKHPVVAGGGNSVECANCHNPHVVTSTTGKVSDPANTYNTIAYATDADRTAFCLKCHSSAALPSYTVNDTTYVPSTVTIAGGDQVIMNKSTYAARGHWSQTGAIGAGEEVTCAECHDNHGSNAAKLLGVYDPATGTNKIGSTTITANNNSVCAGCHTAATGTTYTRLANGYPNIGTWPGTSVYDGGNGIHKGAGVVWPGMTYAGGDCKNCHNVHGTAYAYDELVGQFDPSSAGNDRYALCFNCHDSNGPSTKNIKQYYPIADGGTSTGTTAGHQIKTSGGTLAVGQGLPCYDCHNPHGSAVADGLAVETMIAGTKYLLGDAAGEIDMDSATGVRRFCFSCHTTATGRGTSSTGTGYANISATDLVEGISRNPAVDNNALKLSALAAHTEADTRSCLTCHGGLTADGPQNVHSPSAGAGGGPCNQSGCHGTDSIERLDRMQNDTTTYHHVLDGATPFQNTYPTPSQTTLYCLSCHVDHANFNGAAGNLRSSYNDTPSGASGVNSDFPGNGTYGVCISCHSVALTKNTTGQKAGGSAQTPAISGPNYDASAHDYLINDAAKVGYDGTEAFLANCIKCHDDSTTGPSSRQDGTFKLAPHFSADNRIAQALGVSLAGASTQTEENLCYLCHITATQSGTDAKNIANRDVYDVTAMSAKSEAIYLEFNNAGKPNKHPIGSSSGLHKSDEGGSAGWNPASSRHVECEDCHNPHESQPGVTPWPTNQARRGSTPPGIAGVNKGVWGVSITGANPDGTWNGSGTSGAPTAPTYSKTNSSAYQWQMCLKCHSSWSYTTTPPNVSLNLQNQTGGKQTDVGLDFNPMQLSYHPIFKPGLNQPATNLNPAWASNTTRKWIDLDNDGVNDGAAETDNNGLSNTFTDGWVTTSVVVCTDCHNNSDATGPSGPHSSANKWLLSGVDVNIKYTLYNGTVQTNGSYASANFCINCHRVDVYGTNNTIGQSTPAELSRMNHNRMSSSCYNTGTFNSAALTWSSCLHCHGGRKSEASFNNPANTVVQSGAIHGTSMTYHPSAATYTGADNYMGQRFMNGASWSQHLMGKTTTTVGCYTLSKSGALSADNYSACTKHTPSEYTELQYSY